MSDHGQPEEHELGSPSELLRSLVQAHETGLRQRDVAVAGIKRFAFKWRLSTAITPAAAERLSNLGDQADDALRALSKLIALRDEKRAGLRSLVDDPLLIPSRTEDTQEPATEEAGILRAVIESGRHDLVSRIQHAAVELEALESEITEALCHSPLIKRATMIAEAYEHDGLVADPSAHKKGNVLRRRKEAICDAFHLTLPIIHAVYCDRALKPLSDDAFRSELITRLDNSEQFRGHGEWWLSLCAEKIESVRWRAGKDRRPVRTQQQAVEHLIKRLRHSQMEEWLQPRDSGDGSGSGKVSACHQLLDQLTGVNASSIKAYLAGSVRSGAKQRRPRRR
ncbi:MAG TPA: hypothetical protein VFN67_02190 [Polyangiales bacterium]|nr:hypothetical protein [Polyangiales bacterium]